MAYPLVDPSLVDNLHSMGKTNPQDLKEHLTRLLGEKSLLTAQGEVEPDAMRELEKVAGEMMQLYPVPPPPVALKPAGEIQAKMRMATDNAVARLTRHPEYETNEANPREESQAFTRPTPASIYRLSAAVRFNKTGRTMMINPHSAEADYDFPLISEEGKGTLYEALRDAAKDAGLELGNGIRSYSDNDEKGWVTIGYEWTVNRVE